MLHPIGGGVILGTILNAHSVNATRKERVAQAGPFQLGENWPSTRGFAFLLAAMLFATFPGNLLGWESFVFRDFGYYGYPNAHYFRESFWRGELPHWNPYNNCGIPFLAQWSTLALYPPSLLYLILPLPWSLNLFDLAHVWLGGMAMYWLARRWTGNAAGSAVAGVVFAFNGISLNDLIWPHLTAALGWMPLVILATERAWVVGGKTVYWAALVGAMQMLTGAPEFILFTWGIVLAILLLQIYGAWTRGESVQIQPALRRFVLVGALVCGLSAVQVFPFLELAAQSHRNSQFSTGSWSMPSWGLISFLLPLYRCEPSPLNVAFQPGQLWTSSYYVGIGTLALACVGLLHYRRDGKVLLLGGFSLIGILLAWGDHAPFYGLLRRLCPAVGAFRYPVKAVVIDVFSVPLLAAYGLAALQSGQRRLIPRSLLMACLLPLLVIVGALIYAWNSPELFTSRWLLFRNGLGRVLVLGAVLGMGLCMRLGPSGKTQSYWIAGLLAALWLDGITHVPWQNPTVPASAMKSGVPTVVPPPSLGSGRAMISAAANLAIYERAIPDAYTNYLGNRLALSCNTTLLEELPVVDGFYSLYLKANREIHMDLYLKTNAFVPRLLDFLGVVAVTSPGQLFEFERRPSARPLITAGQQPVFADDSTSHQAVLSADWDPGKVVYLPPEAKRAFGTSPRASAKVLQRQFAPHRVEFDVETEMATVAVIAQAWYPAWEGSVDGVTVPVWKANHAFQAIAVPAGSHRVVIRYRPQSFTMGLLVTSVTLLGIAGVSGIAGRRRRFSGAAIQYADE